MCFTPLKAWVRQVSRRCFFSLTMKQEDFKNILDITTDKPTLVRLSNNVSGWFKRTLQRLKLVKKTIDIEVYPIRLGTRQRYSESISALVDFVSKHRNDNTLDPLSKITKKEIDSVIKGVVYVLHNKETTPPNSLIKTVSNLSSKELWQVIQFASGQLDMENFIESIISMSRMSLQTDEIIASENDLTSLSSKEAFSNTGDSTTVM